MNMCTLGRRTADYTCLYRSYWKVAALAQNDSMSYVSEPGNAAQDRHSR